MSVSLSISKMIYVSKFKVLIGLSTIIYLQSSFKICPGFKILISTSAMIYLQTVLRFVLVLFVFPDKDLPIFQS